MWTICEICGALVAEHQRHADWHAALFVPTPPAPSEPGPAPDPNPEEVL
ncbi:hypothetical protein [Oerskovia paurometabola]|uniref:C2H2-type domain-containing protein n=1 Tax=Oerskovia paurometabola TaxID=162170 RepID=A0ABW1X7N4_9CELL|nr:hypothetical protein [Oerskovia paurometabola]MBM7497816.1 hypothetical protein [Oerskovia paurometabola]